MRTERESLADFIRRIRAEKGFSLSDVSRNSGGQIANSHISRLENGEVKNVTVDKLAALARGLRVTEDEVIARAMGRHSGDPSEMEAKLLTMFRQMPDHWKEDFLRILESLHQQHSIDKVKNIDSKKRKSRAA